jgi:hypothetical protein
MSTFKLLGAVAILSTAIATPAPAQQVISEPGYCAFFYPNANCQNKGPGNPYTDPNARRGKFPTAFGTPEPSNIEQVRVVCDQFGRCRRIGGPRYVYRN